MIKKNLLLLIIILLIIIGIIFIFLPYSNKEIEIKEFDMFLIVSNKTGFDVSKEYIHFGMLLPGQNSTKEINITNTYNKNFTVYLKFSGNFSEWISNENNFIINANETKTIKISAHVPRDAEYGNYISKARVIFKKI